MRTAHDGKVRCNAVEYTTAFLYSDWLYFLWHGINCNIPMKLKPEKNQASNLLNSEHGQLPAGMIAQLEEHCTGIAEVMGSISVQA